MCGGAFLKILSDLFERLEIYGLDFSSSLLKVAQNVIKNGHFVLGEANNVDVLFNNKKFDFIISNSVYNYFPSKSYAVDVIKKATALLSPNGTLAILDLNDVAYKNSYQAIRQGNMSDEEYAKKYDKLQHLFFDKGEIVNIISSLGFQKTIIKNQYMQGYINNQCRFNIIAKMSL